MEGEQFNLPGPFVAAGWLGQPRGGCPYDYFLNKHPHIRDNARVGTGPLPVR